MVEEDDKKAGFVEDLLLETWLPQVEAYVHGWDPKSYEPLLEMVKAWQDLFPDTFKTKLVDQVLVPKLRSALLSWSPTQDRTMVHLWIFPWLAFLG